MCVYVGVGVGVCVYVCVCVCMCVCVCARARVRACHLLPTIPISKAHYSVPAIEEGLFRDTIRREYHLFGPIKP